ncbi:MAG: threonine/serine dehydratase [Gammaproteobacteria bacterium]
MSALSVSPEDVLAAASRLAGHARVTPLLPVSLPESRFASVFVKCENLQIGGAFKFRGAYNRLSQLDSQARARGVVAWSSGNHAQGVAAAGRLLGIRTAIVMPRDAPAIKVENTRAFGAEVRFYDRHTESREDIARALAAERGATLVPSYDDPDVIAGQGTTALELHEQLAPLETDALDVLLVPCGGGGLVGGCALALQAVSPHTRVYAVEPAGFDDTTRSLVSGEREKTAPGATSICDALLAPTPGDLTWPINRRYLSGGIAVSDDHVRAAMRFAWRELKLVVEPGGAVALAAALHGLADCDGGRIGVVLSGGNVDAGLYRHVLE